MSILATLWALFLSNVHNIVKDETLVLNTLEAEDFGLWFLGAFITAYYNFTETKNQLEAGEGTEFNWKIYLHSDWEDLLWVFIGSFGLLIVFGFTGKVLLLNEVISQPAGGWGAEASFLIGLLGAFVIGKILNKIKNKK